MFTIKAYNDTGRMVILAAESFTILRDSDSGEAEVTLHRKDPGDSLRIDVKPDKPIEPGWPPRFQKAFIENDVGKTVERLYLGPVTGAAPSRKPPQPE